MSKEIAKSVFGFTDQNLHAGYFLCAADCSPTTVSTPLTYF